MTSIRWHVEVTNEEQLEAVLNEGQAKVWLLHEILPGVIIDTTAYYTVVWKEEL